MTRRLWLMPAVLLGMAGCALFGDTNVAGCGAPGTPGELGLCEFHYHCLEGDSTCESHPDTDYITGPVAVGAQLSLEANCEQSRSETVHTVSDLTMTRRLVQPDWGSDPTARFQPLVAGPHSLMALTPEGVVDDFVHIWALAPERVGLRMARYAGDDWQVLSEPLELLVHYDQPGVSAVLFAGEQPLGGGELPHLWTTSNEQVVVVYDADRAQATLEGVAPGTAIVGVTVAGLQASFQVVVGEAP